MNSYKHKVSVRLRHDTLNLSEISESISTFFPQIVSKKLVNVGEQRTTSKGEKLEGAYHDSVFSFSFSEEATSSDSRDLEAVISDILTKLENCKDVLNEFSDDGGSIELFVGLFIDANSGISLSRDLIKNLANMNIEIGFDIYPADSQ